MKSETASQDTSPHSVPTPPGKGPLIRRVAVGLCFVTVALFAAYWLKNHFDFAAFVQREAEFKSYYDEHPVIVLGVAFLIYVAIVALAIPIALWVSLTYAWFFGFWTATLLISFASTAGATLSFLIARYLLRDAVQSRFGARLATVNEALEKEGGFYLFTLRLVPLVPFTALNPLMGLTKMSAWNFWWISQLGMLAGTMVYVYAGSRIPDLQTLQAQGVSAVISPEQIKQIFLALALVGLMPLAMKKILDWRKSKSSSS